MLRIIWCLLFHRKHRYDLPKTGDTACDKCGIIHLRSKP